LVAQCEQDSPMLIVRGRKWLYGLSDTPSLAVQCAFLTGQTQESAN